MATAKTQQVHLKLFSVTSIKFERDGFFIGRARVEEGDLANRTIDFKGTFPNCDPGRSYEAYGTLETHPRYGDSYKLSGVVETMPRDRLGVLRYLTDTYALEFEDASAIVTEYGPELRGILDNATPDQLTAIGIDQSTAAQFIAEWQRSAAEKDTERLLIGVAGIGTKMIARLNEWARAQGTTLGHIANEDPYHLMNAPRVGWKTADAIAEAMGVAADDPRRLEAACKHIAAKEEQNGHTWTGKDAVLSAASDMLGLPSHKIMDALVNQERDANALLVIDDQQRCYTPEMLRTEQQLANGLYRLMTGHSYIASNIKALDWQAIFDNAAFRPTDEQQEAVRFLLENKVSILTGGAGVGKALSIDTWIPTVRGWKTMGDLKVGDRVYDENGKPCRVTFATNIMHDHPCYEVIFDDGSSIVADAEHLWLTSTYRARISEARSASRAHRDVLPRGTDQSHKRVLPQVVTTEQIAKTLYHDERINHSIPVCGAIQGERAELPVEPYTFGYWLGDGYSETACFCTVDLQVLDEIQADGYAIIPRKKTGRAAEVYRFGGKNKQHMGDVLRKMNVLKNKHIPVKYLRASYEQRLALIQGIMDADGSINLRGRCEVTVISKKLAYDIYELAIGLGIKAYTDERKASCNGKDCGIAYRVSFTTTLPVFRLGRKLERIPDATRTTTKQRYIVNVRSVASVPVRCIQVNSQSHLYLAGHACIPTHNTTVQRLVLDALHRAGVKRIKLCAPTGKAARRLSETSGMQATTVHRLVNWVMRIDPDSIDARPDVVIVDEASMLDTQVAEWLVNALPDYCHLILVGDDNQLPSVGPGRVLFDLISANVPMTRLTKVLRQAGESKIISTSHSINRGTMPDLDNDPDSDMFLFEVTQPEKVAEHILRLITNAIPEKYGIEPDEITVIAPQYKHACGIEALNIELQAVLNEQSFDKNEVRWFDRILREGDKLIWTANNLDRGLVNGEECRVESIYQDNGKTLIDLDVSTGIPLDELTATHGYAVTVHKAQGSEYPCAIVVAHSVHQFMLTRRLLYTAVTRGKQLGIIIGERSAVQKAVGNIREDGRRTALTERLIALSSPDFDKLA